MEREKGREHQQASPKSSPGDFRLEMVDVVSTSSRGTPKSPNSRKVLGKKQLGIPGPYGGVGGQSNALPPLQGGGGGGTEMRASIYSSSGEVISIGNSTMASSFQEFCVLSFFFFSSNVFFRA